MMLPEMGKLWHKPNFLQSMKITANRHLPPMVLLAFGFCSKTASCLPYVAFWKKMQVSLCVFP
jgi:hypothetical protein